MSHFFGTFPTFIAIFLGLLIAAALAYAIYFQLKRIMNIHSINSRINNTLGEALYGRKPENYENIQNAIDLARILRSTKTLVWFTFFMIPIGLLALFFNFSATTFFTIGFLYGFGVIGIRFTLLVIKSQRRKAFIEDLPNAIELMSRMAATGRSTSEAISMVTEDFQGLLKDEFTKIKEKIALGTRLEDALQEVSEKLQIPEFKYFTIVLTVQTKTGGNVVALLNNLVETLRARKEAHLQMKALIAEPMMSGFILAGLPVFMVVLLSLIKPGYFSPMIDTKIGIMLSVGCVFWQLVGAFIMYRMVRIDV